MTDSSHEPRILICEEGFGSRKILARILSDVGEVDVAINGREALDAVRSARESGEPYDIITLDLMMPEMDGQEALRRIRELEERDHTERATILITTATNDPQAVCAAFREQCDGYLIKPVRKAEILGSRSRFGFNSRS